MAGVTRDAEAELLAGLEAELATELELNYGAAVEVIELEVIRDENNPGYRTAGTLRAYGASGRLGSLAGDPESWDTLWEQYHDDVDQALSNLIDARRDLGVGVHRLELRRREDTRREQAEREERAAEQLIEAQLIEAQLIERPGAGEPKRGLHDDTHSFKSGVWGLLPCQAG